METDHRIPGRRKRSFEDQQEQEQPQQHKAAKEKKQSERSPHSSSSCRCWKKRKRRKEKKRKEKKEGDDENRRRFLSSNWCLEETQSEAGKRLHWLTPQKRKMTDKAQRTAEHAGTQRHTPDASGLYIHPDVFVVVVCTLLERKIGEKKVDLKRKKEPERKRGELEVLRYLFSLFFFFENLMHSLCSKKNRKHRKRNERKKGGRKRFQAADCLLCVTTLKQKTDFPPSTRRTPCRPRSSLVLFGLADEALTVRHQEHALNSQDDEVSFFTNACLPAC